MAEGKATHTAEQEEGPKKRPPWWKRLWARTGFGDKTLWDLLQLFIVPLVLVGIGFWFTAQQDARQQRIEDRRAQQAQEIENQRAEAERELAEQRAQDEALQAYLDQMSSLLLDKGLRESEEASEVRTLARARTLTVLRRLDPSRKTAVIQFLAEAELVQRVKGSGPIISLADANLRDATLLAANLGAANLESATLRAANLRFADLRGTIMPDGTIYLGRYADREFEPALSFSVSDAWRLSYPGLPDELSIEGPEGGQLIFTNPRHVYDPSNPSEPKEVPAPENAEEWVSWFQSHPNLDTSKPIPVSVGGASGMRIDVTASSTPENYSRTICGRQPCVPLYPLSGGSAILSYEDWKYRFVTVDVGEETVLIDVAAPTDKFEEFAPIAQKVLDTVEWENSSPS
jgi:hypothetical protein